ncbi:MAG: oxaloacetate decarboxylase [Clostridiales bacterium]|nr:oxaloacetate decarboxylase [Clostridiales bacterium]
MQFHLDNILPSLWLMLMGMVGIFVVMGIILLAVCLLNRFAGDKQPPEDGSVKGTIE